MGLKLDELERELRSADPKREKAAQKTLVKRVCPELGWLREYVVLNYTAVVKAVKKGNKNLGHTTQAVQLLAGEPIFCSLGLAKLVTRAEMLTVHAAPASERRMEDYCCPICDEVLSNPIMLPCTHRFCFKCITTAHDDDDGAGPTTAPVDVKGLKGALHRGACPVCREPNMNDESSLRVDDALDAFIKQHFHEEEGAEAREEEVGGSTPRVASPSPEKETRRENETSSDGGPRGPIPKALIVVVPGCRSDAMLASDAPTLGGFVRGSGCFSFHMRHTWNGCGNAPSDAVMPLLTGARGEVIVAGSETETYDARRVNDAFANDDDERRATNAPATVFARLAEVRSWVRVGAAVGGARDLARSVTAENAARLLTAPGASDAEAAAEAERALRDVENGEDVVYLHLSGVQDAGAVHGYGPHVTAYRSAVEEADLKIAAVTKALRARRAARPSEDWLVVVSSPAGGTTRADMPVTMQGHFDAADWNGRGGRQLRSAGVTGFDSLPQHATGWVLVDVPAEPGFAGGAVSDAGRACGELLPPPCDVDVAPTLLEHFGVAPRREWGLDGNHLLASRRTDTVLQDESARAAAEASALEGASAGSAERDGSGASSPSGSGSGRSLEAHDRDVSPDSTLNPKPAELSAGIASDPGHLGGSGTRERVLRRSPSSLSAPGPFASHLPGLFEPTGCAVVGHRGFGMNRTPGRGIRENTVASFIAAHGSGAGWCEFDVQVTADGVPVLFHDNLLLVRYGFGDVQALSIRELDLAELKAMSRAAIATAKAAAAGAPDAVAAVRGLDAPRNDTDADARASWRRAAEASETRESARDALDEDEDERGSDDEDERGSELDVVVFYRKFPGHAETEPMPWVMDVEDEIPTLEELMRHAPPELGLSMELKFDEHSPCATPRLVAELRAVLGVCRAHPARRILFSSFDPDAALIMRALQGLYPVMMISDCHPHHPDPRRRSVAAAKRCALDGGLCGLVLNVKVLADGPEVADDVRASGLLLGTYGEENDDKPLATKQVEWGMCLVCTDNVAALAGMFNAPAVDGGAPAPARAPLLSPALAAAAAARTLGEVELDAVLRAPWYKLSEDGKNAKNANALSGAAAADAGDRPSALRRKPSAFIGRIGTAEALSALAAGAAAGLTEVASEARKSGFPIHARTLTDRQPRASKKSAPAQRAGVTVKGFWAAFPQYSPAPRTPVDAAAAAAAAGRKVFPGAPVPYP